MLLSTAHEFNVYLCTLLWRYLDVNIFVFTVPSNVNPCQPSPCGPNSQCITRNEQAVCSCIQGYIGSPPICRPECTGNQDCSTTLACMNQKCKDPCPGTCGRNAKCSVINHHPFCVCNNRFTGDPFSSCYETSNKTCAIFAEIFSYIPILFY